MSNVFAVSVDVSFEDMSYKQKHAKYVLLYVVSLLDTVSLRYINVLVHVSSSSWGWPCRQQVEPQLISKYLFESWLLHFLSSSLQMHLERQREKCLVCLDPCHPHGRMELEAPGLCLAQS